jgi:hypothetical protein
MEARHSPLRARVVPTLTRGEIRPHLPARGLPTGARPLVWLPVQLAIIAGRLAAASWCSRSPPWYGRARPVRLVAGHSWGCLGFLAHEALASRLSFRNRPIEKPRRLRGIRHLRLSPTLWVACTTRRSHGNTGKAVADPDGFGTLRSGKRAASCAHSRRSHPGRRRAQSALFLFVWFSGALPARPALP